MDSWDCNVDEQRKYISFFLYSWVSLSFKSPLCRIKATSMLRDADRLVRISST